MDRPASSDMLPKRDNEKDVELDKKIEALRRKNEALMKRYKEVEEDKKRAEEEGMALQSRKGKADDLTITINKSTNDSRVVVTKQFSSGSSPEKDQQESGPDHGGSVGRGHRKQLTVTMAAKKGKRVVSEKPEKKPDVKNLTNDEQARHVESAGRPKQPAHMTRKHSVTATQEEATQGHAEEQHEESEQQESESPLVNTDLNIPTSREEQEEYLRWKKEREQIDKERLARHKNAKGQWRRAWDVDKTESMFSEKSIPDREWGPSNRGGRNTRKGQQKAGHDRRGKAAKNVLVTSSKAKGKDRLTGRARRWQANEEEENPQQTSETTLEEFLEELDALTETEKEELENPDLKIKASPSPELQTEHEGEPGSVRLLSADNLKENDLAEEKTETSSPRGLEKKVRFSEELVQKASARHDSPRCPLKLSKKNKHDTRKSQKLYERPDRDSATSPNKESGTSALPDAQKQTSGSELTKKHSNLQTSSMSPAGKTNGSLQEISEQPLELPKSNTNTEELIDSGLSVLRLESGDTHQTHPTSSDKARDHGKIVS